eukprot:scaffold39193_cov27-Tisochrysis_lutea.AAC.1
MVHGHKPQITLAEGRRPTRARASGGPLIDASPVPGAARLSQAQPCACARAAGRASYYLPCPPCPPPPRRRPPPRPNEHLYRADIQN